jgi:hypothetical protein
MTTRGLRAWFEQRLPRLPHPEIEWARHSTRKFIRAASVRPWPRTGGKGRRAAQPLGSAEADGLEVRIGLDDLAQPIFGRAIAAIGIGMMPLHQRLELPLDVLH